MPLNTAYTTHEVLYFVLDAEARLVICDPKAEAELRDALTKAQGERAKLETLGVEGEGSLAERAKRAALNTPVVQVNADDVACMLYTSGTTGRSKGAMLTHRCLLSNAQALHAVWHFRKADVLLHALPIFHVHGLFVALNVAMLGGHETIYLDRFDPASVCEQLPQATVFMGVPTFYSRLLQLDAFGRERCQSIRLFTSGSAPMTTQLHEAFAARTGQQICERYGMTECGIITTNPYAGERVAGTVGYALPGYEVRINEGIVEVRGEHLFSGYWRQPQKTQEAFRDDGWFITGDVGSLSEDGRLTLSGRASDMIISGGFNIYPKEVEQVIDTTAGVIESAVVGVPHPDFGEAVVVVVVLDPNIDFVDVEPRIKAACDAHLARFKHPKRWIVADELPRNAMSKVQKSVLRSKYASLFCRPESAL